MPPAYLIGFDEMVRVTSEKSTDEQRGIYWETETQFVIEYPVINNAGQSMGFVFRCELNKMDLKNLLLRLSPGLEDVELEYAIRVFEGSYLTHFYKVVRKVGE